MVTKVCHVFPNLIKCCAVLDTCCQMVARYSIKFGKSDNKINKCEFQIHEVFFSRPLRRFFLTKKRASIFVMVTSFFGYLHPFFTAQVTRQLRRRVDVPLGRVVHHARDERVERRAEALVDRVRVAADLRRALHAARVPRAPREEERPPDLGWE